MATLGKQLMDFIDAEDRELYVADAGDFEWHPEAEARINEFLAGKIEKAVNEKVTAITLGEAGLLLTPTTEPKQVDNKLHCARCGQVLDYRDGVRHLDGKRVCRECDGDH